LKRFAIAGCTPICDARVYDHCGYGRPFGPSRDGFTGRLDLFIARNLDGCQKSGS
jgi:hypothetical protein